ncbi:MAG: UDP-N-acetylmuramoyl-L-alanine--D-glutamate ligase [Dokdonella sp.]|nr:MAG: UDP-N-acetylmuramoyl-L-alanine--D-glutamate ligase [Dokdonella sp.]
MRISDLENRRVAIWGLGREGHTAHDVLRRRIPDIELAIFCSEAEAKFLGSGNALDRYITVKPTAADLAAFDVIIKSPGISAYLPELLEAQHNGTRFTSATALWSAEHPHARVIAVTGTKGKSTTSALIAHLLRALGRRTALAGNIGMPVLELVDAPMPPAWWVIELSSFQTRQMQNVELAVITNIEEEHLDWHGSRERYVNDKLALADAASRLLVNGTQQSLMQHTSGHANRIVFGTNAGWHADAQAIWRGDSRIVDLATLPLSGPHNALNACAALAALEAVGEDAVAASAALSSFRPLPHRLQVLGERNGIQWIDDSIATTPQAAIEALRSIGDRSVCLILGGHDRGLDWSAFAKHVREHPPQAIVLNGASRERVSKVLQAQGGAYHLHVCRNLADAVIAARSELKSSGVILLSPGAPSFDQFHDYAERGRAFAELGGFDAEQIGQIEGLGIA